MKNVFKFGLISLFAFTVVACDKADPAAEFKVFQAWSQEQEKVQTAAQTALNEQITAAMQKNPLDPKEFETIFQNFSATVQQTLTSLESVQVKSKEIKELKDKTQVVLTLSKEILADSVTAITEQTPESQQALQQKTAQLNQAAADLQKAQAEAQQKFGNK